MSMVVEALKRTNKVKEAEVVETAKNSSPVLSVPEKKSFSSNKVAFIALFFMALAVCYLWAGVQNGLLKMNELREKAGSDIQMSEERLTQQIQGLQADLDQLRAQNVLTASKAESAKSYAVYTRKQSVNFEKRTENNFGNVYTRVRSLAKSQNESPAQ